MIKNNKKIIIIFFSFAIGTALYLAFLISNNNELTQKIGVFQYWDMILTRMSIITPDFYNETSFLIFGIMYFSIILLIGFILIKKIFNSKPV